jgi:glutamate synthase (NADPH/NADH) small chain
MIVEAIGQAADVSCLGEPLTEASEWNRHRVMLDADGRTSGSRLWAAGMVSGPRLQRWWRLSARRPTLPSPC